MKLDDVKKLHQKKYRSQLGHYLVEGEHLILELSKALTDQRVERPVTLYVTEPNLSLAQQLGSHFAPEVLNAKQMKSISNTETPQGMIACVPMPTSAEYTLAHPSDEPSSPLRYVYLHEVQDPGNLGTILRSLAWFGRFKLLLSDNSVDPFNPKVVRSSMGAIFHVPLELGVELSALQQRFESFAYLDMQGTPIHQPEFNGHQCYLFGNEARGVPREALLACNASAYTIAGTGSIDSLNLASAVNICAYQLSLASC